MMKRAHARTRLDGDGAWGAGRTLALAGVFVAGLVIVSLLDHVLWKALRADDSISKRDWYIMLRSAGYFPTWLIASCALWLVSALGGHGHPTRHFGLCLSAGASGLAAELLKLIVSRSRPGETGLYEYRGLFQGFADGSNLGMPSSHAAVAFGAAFAAVRLYPGAGWVLLPLAGGCTLTRLMMGDHFTSDAYVAAWLGWLAAWVLAERTGRHGPFTPARLHVP